CQGRSKKVEEQVIIGLFSKPPERATIREEGFVRKWKRSGRQDNGNMRIVDLYQSEKFNPVQERHAIVGDHRIETSFVQLRQGSATIAGRDHRISCMIQQGP